jgi:hypothetical protein
LDGPEAQRSIISLRGHRARAIFRLVNPHRIFYPNLWPQINGKLLTTSTTASQRRESFDNIEIESNAWVCDDSSQIAFVGLY